MTRLHLVKCAIPQDEDPKSLDIALERIAPKVIVMSCSESCALSHYNRHMSAVRDDRFGQLIQETAKSLGLSEVQKRVLAQANRRLFGNYASWMPILYQERHPATFLKYTSVGSDPDLSGLIASVSNNDYVERDEKMRLLDIIFRRISETAEKSLRGQPGTVAVVYNLTKSRAESSIEKKLQGYGPALNIIF